MEQSIERENRTAQPEKKQARIPLPLMFVFRRRQRKKICLYDLISWNYFVSKKSLLHGLAAFGKGLDALFFANQKDK